jgi:hypothetical protein
MGWGTFIAGRLLRTPKVQESNFEEFAGAYIWLGEKFITSYKNRVVQKTVLIHPEIIDKTDSLEWEIDLQKREVNDWIAVQLGVIIYFVVLVIGGAWAIGLPFLPLGWYYIKSRAVKKCAASINKEFQSVGYDVEALLKEIPAIQSKQNDEQKEHLQKIKKEIIKNQEDAYRRKFGIN